MENEIYCALEHLAFCNGRLKIFTEDAIMKKIMAVILSALMLATAVSLASCAEKDPVENGDQQGTQDNTDGQENPDNSESDLAYIQNKGTLVIGITEYEPMNYMENGEWTGFDTELAVAVAKELGVEAEFIEIEWDGKLMELESKAIDCVWNGMTLTDEVLNGMNCTDPYVVNAQVVVMDADKLADYETAEDLDGLTFAVESGSAGEAALNDLGYESTAVQTQADALMEVASGSCDACVIDITMADAMTGEGTSYEDLGYTIRLTEEFYGIGFRKDSDVTAKVNEIINQFASDGTLKALAEKYELTLAMPAE